jgi:hypothetical protein
VCTSCIKYFTSVLWSVCHYLLGCYSVNEVVNNNWHLNRLRRTSLYQSLCVWSDQAFIWL